MSPDSSTGPATLPNLIPKSANSWTETALLACGKLTDDSADGLQRRELLVLDVQSFMGENVLLRQHLLTRGADVAVEIGAGVRLPNVLFVLFGFV